MMAIQKLEDDRCWVWLATPFRTTFYRKQRLKPGLELAWLTAVWCWVLKPVQITAHFKVFRSLLISRQVFTMCIVNGSILSDPSQLRRARSPSPVMQAVLQASPGQGTSVKTRRWWNFYQTFHYMTRWSLRLSFSFCFNMDKAKYCCI